MNWLRVAVLLLAAAPLAAAPQTKGTYATPEEAQTDPDFLVQGEYVANGRGVQVVALGKGKFKVVTFAGGLPGDGWDGKGRDVTELATEAVLAYIKDNGLTRKVRTSPTLLEQPPEGAVVLFDGKEETFQTHWTQGTMTEDGLLMQGARSKDTFRDFRIHLEFRLPYMPEARGQARGNSGYYVQGRYEIQMLDSFGLEGKDNECGGIYQAAAPRVNMCLPPLSWQTYDVDFTAARFDDDGNKTANARVTVLHNGVVIHDNLELPAATPGGVWVVEK